MEFAILTIDWAKRDIEVRGMDGGGTDDSDLTAEKVGEAFDANRDADKTVMAIIYWAENGQLCFHDKASFLAEVEEELSFDN